MPASDAGSPHVNGMFSLKLSCKTHHVGPRLGRLVLKGKAPIDTPNFLGVTSRGVIPHLSQDVLADHTNIAGAYASLEDFIEHGVDRSPFLSASPERSTHSLLRNFIALPDSLPLVLGPRRNPPVTCPTGNNDSGIFIHTSNGFRFLTSEEYQKTVQSLQPDITVGLGDIHSKAKASWRRLEKMVDRTEKWTRSLALCEDDALGDQNDSSLFAPVLPITRELQNTYLDCLATDLQGSIHGLAIYDAENSVEIPESLRPLPLLCLDNLQTPHKLLHGISLGLDIFTIPFISAATDAGIALDFKFPRSVLEDGAVQDRPLGIDMWLANHATDLSPLAPDCECYACKKHHRAYIQHLLSAKEMLAWILLQIHNHHVLDIFFQNVRQSIAQGTFEEDKITFEKAYQLDLPEKTGQGPRVRGYQHRSEGPGEPKKNPPAYRVLNDATAKLSEGPPPSPDTKAEDLETQGFGESTNR